MRLATLGGRSTGKSQLFYDYWKGLAFLEMVRQLVEVKVSIKQKLLSSVTFYH